MKTLSTTLVAMIALSAAQANAGHRVHMDEYANTLKNQTGRLALEIRYRLRDTPRYRHLASDARGMCDLANHIYDETHNFARLDHIQADLAEFDELSHHLKKELHAAKEYFSRRNQFSYHSSRGFAIFFGHHSRDAYQLERSYAMLAEIRETLHYLADDVEKAKRSRRFSGHGRPSVTPVPVRHGAGAPIALNFPRRRGSRFSFSLVLP